MHNHIFGNFKSSNVGKTWEFRKSLIRNFSFSFWILYERFTRIEHRSFLINALGLYSSKSTLSTYNLQIVYIWIAFDAHCVNGWKSGQLVTFAMLFFFVLCLQLCSIFTDLCRHQWQFLLLASRNQPASIRTYRHTH